MRANRLFILTVGLGLPLAGTVAGAFPAVASSDAVRNTNAKQECVRGRFNDYHTQGEGGDPPADYTGRVFKLSQDYPDLDHLGFGGRLAGPVDNPKAACMSCHQTAGFPTVSIQPESSTLVAALGLDDTKTAADHQVSG